MVVRIGTTPIKDKELELGNVGWKADNEITKTVP